MAKTAELKKTLKKDTQVAQSVSNTTTNLFSFLQREKAVLFGATAGVAVAVSLNLMSSISFGLVASVSLISGILSYGFISGAQAFYQWYSKGETKLRSSTDVVNFREGTYKIAYEIELEKAKKSKNHKRVVEKVEKRISEAQQAAPLAEEPTKNLINIYRKGIIELRQFNIKNNPTSQVDTLKKDKLKSR